MAEIYAYEPNLGLVLPERVTFRADLSTFTTSGEIAGVPVPQNRTGLVVQASGDAPAEKVHIRTQEGGLASLTDGATFIVRKDSDSEWFGQEEPHCVQDWGVLPDGLSTDLLQFVPLDSITLSDGSVFVVARVTLNILFVNRFRLRGIKLEPSGSTTVVDIWSEAIDPGVGFGACAVQLSNGRILVYSATSDTTAGRRQVRAHFSDDNTATWGLASNAVLPAALPLAGGDFTILKMSAAQVDNSVALVLSTQRSAASVVSFRDVCIQYASRNGGSSFSEIYRTIETSILNPLQQMAAASVIATPTGLLLVTWIAKDGYTYRRLLGDVFDPIGAGEPVLVDALLQAAAPAAALALGSRTTCETLATRSGDVYAILSVTETYTFSLRLVKSADGGSTWAPVAVGVDGLGIFWRGNIDKTPYNIHGSELAGRIHLTTGGMTLGNSLNSARYIILGKMSNVTLPDYYGSSSRDQQVAWIRSSFAETPVNWDHITATGTAAEALTSDGWEIRTSITARFYTEDLTADVTSVAEILDKGIIRRWVAWSDDIWFHADHSGVEIEVRNGAPNEYNVRIVHKDDYFIVRDLDAGTSQTTSGLTAGVPYEYQAAIFREDGDYKLRVWYRRYTFGGELPFILAFDEFLGSGGGGPTKAEIKWGNIASGTVSSYWRWHGSAHGNWVGTGYVDPYVNPRDLRGRAWPARSAVIQESGTAIRSAGVTIRGDTFTIEADSDVRITNALIGGPRRGWESTNTDETTLVFDISDQNVSTSSDILVISGFGCNIGFLKIVGETLAGADTTLFEGSLSEGMAGLRYVLNGDRVRPDTSDTSTTEPLFAKHELKGSQFATYAGGTWVARRILDNREGKWTDAATARASLYLDGTFSSASGADGRIIPKDWAVHVSMRGAEYRRLKIIIPAPNTTTIPRPAEHKWQIGRLHIGYAVAYPQPVSFGERVTHEPLEEIVESRDGQRSGIELAPTRRRIRTGFVDGTMTYQLTAHGTQGRIDGDPSHYFIEPSGQSVGLVGYELISLDGILRATRGSKELVWLSAIESAQTHVYNRRDALALVYFDSQTARERYAGRFSVYGDAIRGDAIELVEAT